MAQTIKAGQPCKVVRFVIHTDKPLREITESVRFRAHHVKDCKDRKEAQDYIGHLADMARERGYKSHGRTRNTFHANCHTPGLSFLFKVVPMSYQCGEGTIAKD